ncbi:unnamed protein product [Anisakis simplex]|uniref:26S proteasome non-ATPase regulatory subunit 4 n=1 Tax=Anisakis simplex TaxID=6269 RepID=A0A0M3K0P4_ANISI|nr:unnamed protein product [Anisakis simplex]
MVQESTMIWQVLPCYNLIAVTVEKSVCSVDNSEWMRNGDFSPTRLQCQQEAVNLIMQCKLRANPENAVGILSMADTVEVLSTMTQENGKLFMKLHQIEPKGDSDFVNGIKIAHLALKHRQNRNHKMRIVLFVGSPIEHLNANELTKLAKKLKKEKVQVDVVCFGEADSENSEIMGQFVETLNGREGSNGSNLVVVSSGCTLTEALLSSPVCRGEDGAAAPVVTTGGGGFEFGIDPEDDPDLALALRVSLEEQRQRQQQEAVTGGGGGAAETTDTTQQPMDTSAPDIMTMDPGAMTEEQQLEWALRMSMQEGSGASAGAAGMDTTLSTDQQQTTKQESKPQVETSNGAPETASASCVAQSSNASNEQVMEIDNEGAGGGESAVAAQQSNDKDKAEAQAAEVKGGTASTDDQLGQLMSDPELLRQLVADLPGVDPNSQEIQDAVNSAAAATTERVSSITGFSGKLFTVFRSYFQAQKQSKKHDDNKSSK